MNIKLSTVTTLVISALVLTACQTPLTSTALNQSIEELPITLVPDTPDSDSDGVLDDIDNCPKTPVNTVVDSDGCPIAKDLMGPFALEIRTYFERGSTEFSNEDYVADIDKIAEKFAAYAYLPTVILGHISKPEALLIQNADSKPVLKYQSINNWHRIVRSLLRIV